MHKLYSNYKIILILYITIISYKNAFSSVNIISWWNYLDKNTISKLQNKCKTSVSLDEYYSSDEFLRRFQKQKYSIVIFPGGVYNLISDKIGNTGINFGDIKSSYHSNVLYSFNRQNFSNNIGIFALGITGFLYDPKKIVIDTNENFKSIFLKAKDKKIALIDDPFESLKLISFERKILNVDDGVKEFRKLIDGTNFIITNDTVKIAEEKDFALAYTWVGIAFRRITENPDLKFIVHPKLAYISADFIATLDKNSQTACIAKMLASKEILNPILSRTFYFSPYGFPEKIKNKDFALEYKNFIINHNQLDWLEIPKKDEYQKMINLWQKIKIAMGNKFY
jgi:hypothetical protein